MDRGPGSVAFTRTKGWTVCDSRWSCEWRHVTSATYLIASDLGLTQIERTLATYSDTASRNGRTVTGAVREEGVKVGVWFPETQDDVIDGFKPGSVHPVTGTRAEFDRLNLRPTVRADDSPKRLPTGIDYHFLHALMMAHLALPGLLMME